LKKSKKGTRKLEMKITEELYKRNNKE